MRPTTKSCWLSGIKIIFQYTGKPRLLLKKKSYCWPFCCATSEKKTKTKIKVKGERKYFDWVFFSLQNTLFTFRLNPQQWRAGAHRVRHDLSLARPWIDHANLRAPLYTVTRLWQKGRQPENGKADYLGIKLWIDEYFAINLQLCLGRRTPVAASIVCVCVLVCARFVCVYYVLLMDGA
jgi:hypothetical protein